MTTSDIFTVYRLWPEDQSGAPLDYNPALAVIFFHGLQIKGGERAWETTWSSKSGPEGRLVCWPKEWLPEDLGKRNVVVYSLSYDADAIKWNGRGQTDDVKEIGKDLIQKLIADTENKYLNQTQSIALVGHSFGGLVLKSLVVEAKKLATLGQDVQLRNENTRLTSVACKAFLANVKCAIFYATPHSGSDAATLAQNLQRISRIPSLSGILKNLRPFERAMEELSVAFEDAARQDIITFAFAEGRPTHFSRLWGPVLVVSYASAMRLTGNSNMKIEEADHSQVCKPPTKRHTSYTKLVQLLRMTSGMDLDPDDLT